MTGRWDALCSETHGEKCISNCDAAYDINMNYAEPNDTGLKKTSSVSHTSM